MKQIQFTLRVEQSIYDQASAIAQKESRSVNQVLCLLLTQALKERGRKRKGGKEDNT